MINFPMNTSKERNSACLPTVSTVPSVAGLYKLQKGPLLVEQCKGVPILTKQIRESSILQTDKVQKSASLQVLVIHGVDIRARPAHPYSAKLPQKKHREAAHEFAVPVHFSTWLSLKTIYISPYLTSLGKR